MRFFGGHRKTLRFTAAILVVVGLALICLALRSREPSYRGRTMTEWLYSPDRSFVLIPNDLYGHIQSELWEWVVEGGYSVPEHNINFKQSLPSFPPDAGTAATQEIGTKAIPRLLELISAQRSLGEECRGVVAPYLPVRWADLLFQSTTILDTARSHAAACKGFAALGTNAEPALPALREQLKQPGADFELGCAIASIGPKGRTVLVNALTNGSGASRDIAAFCLGETPQAREEAVPMLLSLIERDKASYQVLGALGRLGGDAETVVPVLTRFLERVSARGDAGSEPAMAILTLGLFREKAQKCVPALTTLYPHADPTTRQVIRMVIKRIKPTDAQCFQGRAPAQTDDEDPWWNGTKP